MFAKVASPRDAQSEFTVIICINHYSCRCFCYLFVAGVSVLAACLPSLLRLETLNLSDNVIKLEGALTAWRVVPKSSLHSVFA